jgi:arginine/lysine/ornithine decarboxylase
MTGVQSCIEMDNKPNENTIVDFLVGHKNQDPVSFHMPGHKGRTDILKKAGYTGFVKNMFGNDITEIPGADALQQPKGAIRRLMENYADLYGAKHTELLVNGSSAGIIAAILAVVPAGGELIMGRNSHTSAFNALRLGGISPVYVKPDIDPKYELQGPVPVEAVQDALEKAPDAEAVLITSPNYYGVLSNVRMIAKVVHEAGKILIVDQAHGAHLKFFDATSKKKMAAENCDADIVVNSIHKTLFSFTGSAILNICSDRVDIDTVADRLRQIQTTSPSYLLMGSLDVNEKIMRKAGEEIAASWRNDLREFYASASKIAGLKVVSGDDLDMTKINISMSSIGLDGAKLERELINRNIWPEMAHGDYVMLLTGAGNTAADYEALIKALKELSVQYGVSAPVKRNEERLPDFDLALSAVPDRKERIPLYEAEGRVLYDPIVPYPPGVPIACPGEILDYEVIAYIHKLVNLGEVVTGVDDEGTVAVGVENSY